jgi:hypothetical protein
VCLCFLLLLFRAIRDFICSSWLRCAIFPLNENKCPGSPHITTNHNLRSLVSCVCIFLVCLTVIIIIIIIVITITVSSFSSLFHHEAQKTYGNLNINLLDGTYKRKQHKNRRKGVICYCCVPPPPLPPPPICVATVTGT